MAERCKFEKCWACKGQGDFGFTSDGRRNRCTRCNGSGTVLIANGLKFPVSTRRTCR